MPKQTFIINDLEIMPFDTSKGTNWEDSVKSCKELEYGGHKDWRLPTREELNIMYLNRELIGGFTDGRYWSSSEYDAYFAWTQFFLNGSQNLYYKYNTFYVRAVRTIINKNNMCNCKCCECKCNCQCCCEHKNLEWYKNLDIVKCKDCGKTWTEIVYGFKIISNNEFDNGSGGTSTWKQTP